MVQYGIRGGLERSMWLKYKGNVAIQWTRTGLATQFPWINHSHIAEFETYADANVDTEAEFEAFLEKAFTKGNVEKYAFMSPAFVTMINTWAKNKVTKVETDKSYGIRIVRYDSPHGTLNMIKHDLLTGTPFGNYCIVLDMENLTYRYLQNRDTKLLTNRQANDEDSIKEEYLTECGLQIKLESTHALCSKGSL